MTQEEQTALVDGQQAAVTPAPASDAKKEEDVTKESSQQDSQQATNEQTQQDQAASKANGEEGEPQYRALFKQIIRMRSVRKLSPAAKAAKSARQAAKAATNAARAAETAAKAADVAAKAAQEAAQAAFDENTKAEEKLLATEKVPEPAKSENIEANKTEEVAAK